MEAMKRWSEECYHNARDDNETRNFLSMNFNKLQIINEGVIRD